MAKFRKKPVVIDAMQYYDANTELVLVFGEGKIKLTGQDSLDIATLEGTMQARIGDWIIKGVAGEFYPCKPDIFAATYERVLDDTGLHDNAINEWFEDYLQGGDTGK